jgi:hypothetical protein
LVKEHHSARGFSSKHSVKASAVGSTSSFSRRVVSRLGDEAFGNAWWRGLNLKKGWIDNRCETDMTQLSNKCCNRGRLGVVLERGYKYEPLVFVIGIEQFHNKPALCQLSSPSSRVVEFFERNHQSVDLRKYRQPCIMSSIMQWI